MAHNEPPHPDLRCLQINLFASLVLKELTVQEEPYFVIVFFFFVASLSINGHVKSQPMAQKLGCLTDSERPWVRVPVGPHFCFSPVTDGWFEIYHIDHHFSHIGTMGGEKKCAMEPRLRLRKFAPPAGSETG